MESNAVRISLRPGVYIRQISFNITFGVNDFALLHILLYKSINTEFELFPRPTHVYLNGLFWRRDTRVFWFISSRPERLLQR